MRYPIFLLVVLGLLSTHPITNLIHGRLIFPGPPLQQTGYGSIFGILGVIILGVTILPELLQRRNSTPTTPAPGCPSTYYLYSTECGRFCYRYESSTCKSWSAARTVCRVEGGDLLVPSECYYQFFKDQAQQNEGNCPTQFWLGGSSTVPGTNYVTVGGAPISNAFSFWNPGQPESNGGTESCLEMRKTFNYLMNDFICRESQGFICQILI